MSAFDQVNSILISFLRKTSIKTIWIPFTLFFTILNRWKTFWIFFTSLKLVRTLLLDTVPWIGTNSGFFFTEAMMIGSTLSNIDCSLVTLLSQTQFPAAVLRATFLLAILESWKTFGILLACCPLIGAVLFDAFLRIDGDKGFRGFRKGVLDSDFKLQSDRYDQNSY